MSTEVKPYQVYLAVPGTQFCWGTTTGVINSTAKHTVHPQNGGLGFSGVEDFNLLWIDALNLFEAGEISHFAMLHGDIMPDPEQRWIDVLLEEMDLHGAELVSAHSPIKDDRGLTSSGICNLADPWSVYRRFTQREILEQFPATFNAALAGYPDRPLLHNTGCWVCDLSKPVFHEVKEDGSLRTLFKFPEKATRGPDGKWRHHRESEDWCFSRELWERGARNTWITSRVRLTHSGRMDWRNWVPFGKYKDGDEQTAHHWRKDVSEPLATLQLLNFELGSGCNLGVIHGACPNLHPQRYGSLDTSRELDNETIVSCATKAYRELGFTGLIGFHYYNEPLIQADRLFSVLAAIKQEVPAARFILWTNGMLIPEECGRFAEFEQIVISGYNEAGRRGLQHLAAKGINARWCEQPGLDDRLQQITVEPDMRPCLRPFLELVVDNFGNTHFCCYDWQGQATLGNVFQKSLHDIARDWRDMLPAIVGSEMTAAVPSVCSSCPHKQDKYQQHDERIVARCRTFRAKYQMVPIYDESGSVIGAAAPEVVP